MRKLTYMFTVSLDGYYAANRRDINWAAPDQELHEFYNDRAREVDTELYGRRMYELMNSFWPTADANPDSPPYVVEFAKIWKATPIVVFSTTLDAVEGNARLVKSNAVEEVRALKALPGGDMAIGGGGLAASLMPHGLIDEYRLVVMPVVLGGGSPFFPALDDVLKLRLVETRTFGSGAVYLRYATMTT